MDRNDDEGLFRAIIEKILEGYRRDLRGHRVLLFAALEGHEVALEHNRQISFPIFELLCQYIARRQSEGALRQGNPGAIVAAVAGMAAHYATMTQMFGFCANSDDRQIADIFVGILMQGIQGNQATQGAQ
jgi:AcrR family transcriptional regulator